MATSKPYTIRDVTQNDVPWIMSSWLESLKEHAVKGSIVKKLPGDEYFPRWRKVIEGLMARSQVYVACSPDDPSTILGWACVEPKKVVHYVHVKRLFQGLGVCNDLLLHAGIDRKDPSSRILFSHRTSCWDRITIPESWEFKSWLIIGL